MYDTWTNNDGTVIPMDEKLSTKAGRDEVHATLARSPITAASLGLPEVKDRDWLMRRVTKLFDDASDQPDPDHPVCAKYAEILMKLLPGGSSTGRNDAHPDAKMIEALRQAVQGSVP